ncbi:MOSC domain-containing protein [Alkalihalobacillus sp. MEB130]|uniref:MOSC domain-containing protein n=1 Tax=Alkalihalobacillus sp. MEB130 TaxID=2976704 RepID=UPI0028DF3C67|nr:MOSC domain-containing protein [Alkalihalobacillus sp. MEB130]MDT8861630.1 MOSC domain-containing protein [Alkalihalobacillus sp. MEB130]
MKKGIVLSLNTGRTKNLAETREKEVLSAINKQSVGDEVLFLSSTHIGGDEQADLINHGGEDKAVCVYPHEHYSYWNEKLGLDLPFGAFGENITIEGIAEADAFIGDTFQWGEAVVQVSQPRRPCFKVAKRHGIKKFPLFIQETGYSGYYLRVLQEGNVSACDSLLLLERRTDVSVESVNKITYQDKHNPLAIQMLLQLPQLSKAWKESL